MSVAARIHQLDGDDHSSKLTLRCLSRSRGDFRCAHDLSRQPALAFVTLRGHHRHFVFSGSKVGDLEVRLVRLELQMLGAKCSVTATDENRNGPRECRAVDGADDSRRRFERAFRSIPKRFQH